MMVGFSAVLMWQLKASSLYLKRYLRWIENESVKISRAWAKKEAAAAARLLQGSASETDLRIAKIELDNAWH